MPVVRDDPGGGFLPRGTAGSQHSPKPLSGEHTVETSVSVWPAVFFFCGAAAQENDGRVLRVCVGFRQQKSTLAFREDEGCLRAESHGEAAQPRAAGSITSPCHSAAACRATRSPPREAFLNTPPTPFFLNNEAKIKIRHFHSSLFSQPAEHKALLPLPLAPWPCLFLPWSSN